MNVAKNNIFNNIMICVKDLKFINTICLCSFQSENNNVY